MSFRSMAVTQTTRVDAETQRRIEDIPLGDLRFRNLLSADEWAALPIAVRQRFSKRLGGGRTIVYTGLVVETELSPLGMALAQLVRVIGAPLPTSRDVDVPAVVTVTEDMATEDMATGDTATGDMATGGQIWTRLYARRRGFPQIIQSSKRFAGKTGIEEHIGRGIGMYLSLAVESEALLFKSAGYFWQIGGLRLSLPDWLAPGRLTVGHHDLGEGRFAFTLDIEHPWFGCLIHQRAVFEDAQT